VRVATENDARNVAIPSIDRALGYLPDCGYVVLEQSLADERDGRSRPGRWLRLKADGDCRA
jgi:hypothetical protein